jgi:hypothetical protein
MISFLRAIYLSLLLYHQSLSTFYGNLPHQAGEKASLE